MNFNDFFNGHEFEGESRGALAEIAHVEIGESDFLFAAFTNLLGMDTLPG